VSAPLSFMNGATPLPPRCPPPRCPLCGDVIGVYEPMVLVNEHGPRETSGAAEPTLGDAPGARFHRDCFAAWSGEADVAG
jgi:hypothetical protein